MLEYNIPNEQLILVVESIEHRSRNVVPFFFPTIENFNLERRDWFDPPDRNEWENYLLFLPFIPIRNNNRIKFVPGVPGIIAGGELKCKAKYVGAVQLRRA